MIDMILRGIFVSGSLIMAIGSQNAFVLKGGLLKENIFIVCLICFLCDVILMSVAILFVGEYLSNNQLFTLIIACAGALFLIYYGYLSFKKSFFSSDSLTVNDIVQNNSAKKAILSTLAVTLLNPHVYLDTVVIIGGISATLTFTDKIYFLVGTLSVSFIWFFGIGYGVRFFAPFFQSSRNWRILEFVIGCIMWFIAFGLLQFIITTIKSLYF